MTRGVSFDIPQITGNSLWQILNCLDVEKYCWYNIDSQNEVWESPHGELFFKKEFYDGEEFLKCIALDHYIIFLKLQAYFDNSNFFDIHTYEEFQKSDCQLLLLINDCEYVEIYAKDQAVIEAIYENALKNNFTKVKYTTESNDGRTKMDVL